MYYKRLDSDFWRGPATVIGRDNHQVVVKHGGIFVRTHPVSLKKVHSPHKPSNGKTEFRTEPEAQSEVLYEEEEDQDTVETGDLTPDGSRSEATIASLCPIHESSLIEIDQENDNTDIPANGLDEVPGNNTLEDLLSEEVNALDSTLPMPTIPDSEALPEQSETSSAVNFRVLPSKKTRILFRDRVREEGQSDEWKEGNVFNRAGKSWEEWRTSQDVDECPADT